MVKNELLLPKILELDGLRGVACLIVLLGHSITLSFGVFDFGYGNLIRGIPKIGVWLFFVLSAFLLSLQLAAEPINFRTVVNYLTERTLRILPPLMLAVWLYRSMGMIEIDGWTDVSRLLTGSNTAMHLWTIPPEFSFYLILPALIFMLIAIRTRFGLAKALLVLAVFGGVSIAVWPPFDTPENSHFVGWYLYSFFTGVAAAILAIFHHKLHCRLSLYTGLASWMAIFLIILLAKLNIFGNAEVILVTMHPVFSTLWALIVFSVYANRRFYRIFLSSKILVGIGRSSYSIYLFHWAICVYSSMLLSPPAAFLASIVLSILVGMIGYEFIERPIYRLRKQAVSWTSRVQKGTMVN